MEKEIEKYRLDQYGFVRTTEVDGKIEGFEIYPSLSLETRKIDSKSKILMIESMVKFKAKHPSGEIRTFAVILRQSINTNGLTSFMINEFLKELELQVTKIRLNYVPMKYQKGQPFTYLLNE